MNSCYLRLIEYLFLLAYASNNDSMARMTGKGMIYQIILDWTTMTKTGYDGG
ncbi:MAG TPA: hypothetical protein VHV83_02210 [Armatimonadota bacterium]|nr:hypothetical protein [Armatimonadota bacterium]